MKVQDLRIGQEVFAFLREDRKILKMKITEIRNIMGQYNVRGITDVWANIDDIYLTKEEAISAYLSLMHKEMINVLTNI